MATRAERFKAMMERQGEKNGSHKAKKASRPEPAPGARTGSRAKNAAYPLEEVPSASRPSRKSSRGGKGVKAATPLTGRQKLRMSAPAQQHRQRAR
jgi:hypothetical protein